LDTGRVAPLSREPGVCLVRRTPGRALACDVARAPRRTVRSRSATTRRSNASCLITPVKPRSAHQ